MKIHITEVDWDFDDDNNCIAPPTDIEDDIPDITEEMTPDEKDDAIANWLSNTFGWCVNGFQYTITKEAEE